MNLNVLPYLTQCCPVIVCSLPALPLPFYYLQFFLPSLSSSNSTNFNFTFPFTHALQLPYPDLPNPTNYLQVQLCQNILFPSSAPLYQYSLVSLPVLMFLNSFISLPILIIFSSKPSMALLHFALPALLLLHFCLILLHVSSCPHSPCLMYLHHGFLSSGSCPSYVLLPSRTRTYVSMCVLS